MREAVASLHGPSGHIAPKYGHVPKLQRQDATEVGTLKWFDARKNYGFITNESGVDVFMHAKTVRAFSINEKMLSASPGIRLRFKSRPGPSRPEAIAVFVER